MKRLLLLAGVFLAGNALAAGAHDHAHGEELAAQIGEPAAAKDAARTISVIMRDNYYEPETLTVSAGEIVRFTVENKGLLVHEFNIGVAEMHAAHRKEMLMMVQHGVLFPNRIDRKKMEEGGEDGHSMKHDDPNSVLLEPGETGEIVWKFPAAAKLEFACNIPGHYESGMAGDIKLQ